MEPWNNELFMHSTIILPFLRAFSLRLNKRLNMVVKSQKLDSNLQSNLTFCAFSPCKAYHEGSMKVVLLICERAVFGGHFPPSSDSLH